MISKQDVLRVIEDKVIEDGCFIVLVEVKGANRIVVHIDSMEGVGIDYCIQINKLIESSFDREVEDYELEVSSPGLGLPLRVLQQYKKNIGKEVEVLLLEGKPQKGLIIEVDEEGFTIEEEKKVKIEGTKKKELKTFSYHFKFADVKAVRNIITF